MCSDDIYITTKYLKLCSVIFNKSFTSLSVNRIHQIIYRFMIMFVYLNV